MIRLGLAVVGVFGTFITRNPICLLLCLGLLFDTSPEPKGDLPAATHGAITPKESPESQRSQRILSLIVAVIAIVIVALIATH